MHAEPTDKQWPSTRDCSRGLIANAYALFETADSDAFYGRLSSAARQRSMAHRQLRWAGFVLSFPEGTSVTGYWSQAGGFRFRVPAPVGVAS